MERRPARRARDGYRAAVTDELTIHDAAPASRLEAHIGASLAGFVDYRLAPGRRILIHTEVLPAFEGRGVGSALARYIVDAARRDGRRLTVKCPFLASWFERHPEDQDVIAIPARGAPGDDRAIS